MNEMFMNSYLNFYKFSWVFKFILLSRDWSGLNIIFMLVFCKVVLLYILL